MKLHFWDMIAIAFCLVLIDGAGIPLHSKGTVVDQYQYRYRFVIYLNCSLKRKCCRSPYFGNHNGPSQVALNGPTTVSQGVRRMISTSRPINVPSIVKIPLILPDGSSIGHKWQTTKGLDQPSPEETTIMGKADYEYWVKWTEVLPYRFDSMRPTEIPVDGFDFKLSIWRSKKGWKWWLLHSSTIPDMSIENQFIWLEPFTKPSLVTVYERGKFSAKSFQPRRASKLLLDEIKQNAELRWGGVPVSEKEKQKGE